MADCEKKDDRSNMSNKRKKRSKQNCELQKPIRCECECELIGDTLKTSHLDSERCLLCNCERFENYHNDNLLENSQASNSPGNTLQLPLWVCPNCRKCVEEEEMRAAFEPSVLAHDLMMEPSLNLTLSVSTCGCQKSSTWKNHNNAENQGSSSDKDHYQLQSLWNEVCNFVRCVYREAGTCLADGEETVRNTLDEDRFKSKVERLLSKDPHQMFEKLESQAREYVKEVNCRLISFLSSCPLSPQHAREFFSMLLDEYQALCHAADVLRPFFLKLENPILKHFNLSWTSLHKHLFYYEIYRDSGIHDSLPAMISQLRLGASSPKHYHQDTYPNLLHRYLMFTEDMTQIDLRWRDHGEQQNTKSCQNRCKCDTTSSDLHTADLPSGLLSCDDLLPTALMMNGLDLRNCTSCDKGSSQDTATQQQGQCSECQCSKCLYHNSNLDIGLNSTDVPHTHHPSKVCSNGHPTPYMDPHLHQDSSLLHGRCIAESCCHGNLRSTSDNGGVTPSLPQAVCTPDLNGVSPDGSCPGSPNGTVRGSADGTCCDAPPGSGSTTEDSRAGTGKYCDCCYCEFFGHAAPPVAPTSHNYTEMRDKLRQRLTKKKPRSDSSKSSRTARAVDDRSVDDLLSFINGSRNRLACEQDSNAKKRSRQRQKKSSDKVQDKLHTQTPAQAKSEIVDDKSKESENKKKNQYNNKEPERLSQSCQNSNTSNKTQTASTTHASRSMKATGETKPAKKPTENADTNHVASTCQRKPKAAGRKKNKAPLDDVFLPRNDLEHGEAIHDEAERELEEFKRFCMTPGERRERISVNVNMKTLTKRTCSS